MNMNDDMASNGDMDGMDGMSMVMTFGSWSDYQLKLLFDSWDITTKWQFALSWFAVVAATATYQGIKFWLIKFESKILSTLSKRAGSGEDMEVMSKVDEEFAGAGAGAGAGRNVFSNGGNLVDKLLENSTTISMSFKLRVAHAFVSAVNYGFALMLMLVAMTYNCSLFLALMVGYFLGDMIFYNRTFTQRASSAYDGVSLVDKDCH